MTFKPPHERIIKKVYSHTKRAFVLDIYRSSFENERWEQLPGGHPYYVSNFGRVIKRVLLSRVVKVKRNVKPFTRRKPGSHRKFNYHKAKLPSMHVIHPAETGGGRQLRVWKNKERIYNPYMQHLVADLFQLREPHEKVLFRDGDEWNPRLSNLKVEGSNQSKLSNRQKAFCYDLFSKYPSNIIIPELAARFCVGHVTIWRVFKEYENENTVIKPDASLADSTSGGSSSYPS